MTNRERVKKALAHEETDRIPIDLGGIFTSAPESTQKRLVDILGITGERDPYMTHFDDRIQKYFDCDIRAITPNNLPYWGFTDFYEAPLRNASIEDLEHYPWPEGDDAMIKGLEEKARYIAGSGYFMYSGQIADGIFEQGCYMRGYDQFLIDCAINKDFVHAFNRKVLDVSKKLVDHYFSVVGPYVDIVLHGDDLATQNAPYMSPESFRELFKPYFIEFVDAIKKHCPNGVIEHHCCGSSFRLLDDIKEIGFDVINPVQTTANEMSAENLVTKKDKLSFHGGVDLQHVLPYGTKEEIETFVKNLIDKLGKNGGYILGPCHTLPDDVSAESVIIMMEAAKKWGVYRKKKEVRGVR
ncbi:uroporphyrinogen decarboxylase family protein [Spirochaetota bacterium]